MADNWQVFLEELGTDTANILKGELSQLINTALSNTETFVIKQANKLERYLNQFGRGDIDKATFELLIKNLEHQTRMESLKMKVAAKASSQRLADGIKGLVINRLMGLIP